MVLAAWRHDRSAGQRDGQDKDEEPGGRREEDVFEGENHGKAEGNEDNFDKDHKQTG